MLPRVLIIKASDIVDLAVSDAFAPEATMMPLTFVLRVMASLPVPVDDNTILESVAPVNLASNPGLPQSSLD